MNKTILIGRLTKDADVRYTPQGTAVARFTLAVQRNKEEADFISCKAFKKTAELIEKYTKKGDRLAVTGRIETGSYEKDGKKVFTTEIIANEVEFLESKKDSKGEENGKEEGGFVEAKEEELPFNFDADLPF